MTRGVVIDANVWISSLLPQEQHSTSSDTFIARHTTDGGTAICPTVVLTEIAGSLARRTGNPAFLDVAMASLRRLSGLRIVAVDEALAMEAVAFAIDLRLRGADAVYVALAARLGVPLVTWDNEVLERAASRITVFAPNDTT